MKIMNKLSALALSALLLVGAPASAQQPAAPHEGTSAEMPWFIPLSYNGFNFDIPAGSIVEKGSTILVKYPDGSFGLSITNVESEGGGQQGAFLTCRKLASQLKLENQVVKKETIGGVDGAIAKGTLEGREVTVIILPVSGQETTMVMMATPNRQAWADHFRQSISR